MGFKNWFTKRSKVVLQEPSKTTRLFSLYGETTNLDNIKAKIKEIEDTLNNIPEVPDLSVYYTKTEVDNKFYSKQQIDAKPYALKNADNQFVNQSIKGSTAFVGFVRTNGQRNGYVGKSSSSSNNIELNAETNNLVLKANLNVELTPNGSATYSKVPTENNHIANKKYVDDKIAAIPTPPEIDTSTLAKLNEKNTFTSQNIFGELPKAYNDSGEPLIPTFPVELVTKKYVDDNDSKITNYGSYQTDGISWIKSDLSGGLYKYNIGSSPFRINIPESLRNKNIYIAIYIERITNNNLYVYPGTLVASFTGNIPASSTIITPNPYTYISDVDLKRGSSGEFTAGTIWNYIILER